MIKLVDLLREMDIRKGSLGQTFVNDDELWESFFYNFDFFEKFSYNFSSGSPVDESELEFNVLSEVEEGYKLIEPINVIGTTKYLVKPSGKTWKEYIVGSVDVEEVTDKPYGLRGGQIVLTYISELYRGQGLGSLMYYMVLVHYVNLFSDNILYEGSRAIWTNKIYPATQLGGFFGIEINGGYAPLTLEDAKNNTIMKMQDVVSYVASTNPSSQMITLQDYLDGLSLSKGEYGIYTYKGSSKGFEKLVSDLLSSSGELNDVIADKNMIYHDVVANAEPEAILVSTSDRKMFIVTNDLVVTSV
jgi:hypothetical protein